jgi:hypothetical protein
MSHLAGTEDCQTGKIGAMERGVERHCEVAGVDRDAPAHSPAALRVSSLHGGIRWVARRPLVLWP